MKQLLTVVIVLQAMILFTQWTGSGYVSTANAQVPDAGAQRLQILDELKSLNAKTDHLIATLDSGHLQVTVANPDKPAKR